MVPYWEKGGTYTCHNICAITNIESLLKTLGPNIIKKISFILSKSGADIARNRRIPSQTTEQDRWKEKIIYTSIVKKNEKRN